MMDLHYENDMFHPETKLFPPHNIEGTAGRNYMVRLKAFYNNISGNSNIHYLNKRRYDSFYGTPLDSLLREKYKKILKLWVFVQIFVFYTLLFHL